MSVRVALCAILVGLAVTSTAVAQDATTRAREHFKKAGRLYDVGEYREALKEYKEAYLVREDPAFLFNMAQCHRKLGEVKDALERFKSYQRRAPDASNRLEVERIVADLERGHGGPGASPVSAAPSGPAAAAAAPAAATPRFPAEPAPPRNAGPTTTGAASPSGFPPPSDASAAPSTARGGPGVGPPGGAMTAGPDVALAPPVPAADPRGDIVASPADRPAEPPHTRWWLWVGIGAVVVAGTAALLVANRATDPPCRLGFECK